MKLVETEIIGDMAIKDLSPKDSNIGGRLVKNLRICGSGIYTYGISEVPLLGLPPVPEKYKALTTINVYRPADVLVANKDKFARIPIITGHHVKVDTSNAKQLAVGMVGDTVTPEVGDDGETYLYTTGTIIAGDGIEAYEDSGQLSVGYVPTMIWQEGTHKGVEYQAVLTGFECVNHLLLCKIARGGPQCMVMDSLDDCASPLEKFIRQNGGEDMGIFKKIFGSVKKEVAGDAAVVSVLLQSIAAGADPKVQVQKVRDIIGDSIDNTFSGYLDELSQAKSEKPEVITKAVEIVDNYYREHLAGDESKTAEDESKSEDKDESKSEDKDESKSEDKEEKKSETKDESKSEDKEEKKSESKTAGDAIDYDLLADKVVERLSSRGKMAGDENVMEEFSMPMCGDTSSSHTQGSDDFMKEIWG